MKKFQDFFDDYFKKVKKKNLPKPEVSKGEEVEQEHINPSKRKTKLGKKLAKMIAKQHVEEDPKYYSKMEKWHKD
jgi:hypothetical protein